jgi:hypothetical protein
MTDQKNKLTFLSNLMGNPNPAIAQDINFKKAIEIQGKVVGLTEDEIKQLLDTSEYGNAEIVAECELDIEGLLEGKQVKPNKAANLAYKQHFVDYLIDHEDDMTHEQFMRLAAYIGALEPVIMKNTVRELQAKIGAMGLPPGPQGPQPNAGAGAAPGAVVLPPQSPAGGGIPAVNLPANPAPQANAGV